MTRTVVWVTGIGLLIAASAIDASAQMTMGTFKGYLTGHVGVVTSGDVTNERVTAGASVAVHETNGWGAEVDFGRATDVDASRQVLDLATYFVNAAWVKPQGVVRPFGLAGAGILQTDGCISICTATSPRTYDLGFNAGGGVFLAMRDFAGIRADVRYFFSSTDHPELQRPGNFAFWRVSVGATFMWVIVP
jgi:hypothetical protein